MNKQYRIDYAGEFVIKNVIKNNGIVHEEREWIEPADIVRRKTHSAVVIGNGESRLDFDLKLLGKKVETYGCNATYRTFELDYLVATKPFVVDEIVQRQYTPNHKVYTRYNLTKKYPGHFMVIPHDRGLDSGTTAVKLACFDGHKKVFLLGFDTQNIPTRNNNVYGGTKGYDGKDARPDDAKKIRDLAEVFNLYSDVEFYRVNYYAAAPMPESWKYCTNLQQISFQEFISKADLGIL